MKFALKFTLIFIFLLSLTTVHSTTAQTDDSCRDALPGRLIIGEFGHVTPGSSNNVRAEPSRNAARIGQIPGGGEFTVLDGPRCADGLIWWEVDYDGLVGWTVEGADGEYWLEPLHDSRLICVSNLIVGEQAESTNHNSGFIYVEPSLNSAILGEIPEWTLFDVIGGPVCDEVAVWVEVYHEGVTGWFMEYGKASLMDCFMCSDDRWDIFARLPLRPLDVVEFESDDTPFLTQQPVLAADAITLNNVDEVVTLQVVGDGSPSGFAWSSDESHITISGLDHIRIYHINRLHTPIHTITGFEALVNRGRYSPEGRLLVAGDQAGVVHIWDAADYQFISRLEHDGAVNATVFSNDGAMLAVSSESGINIWSMSDPAKPTIIYEIPVHSVHMEFVFNDTHLLYISPDAINVLDLDTGELTLSETRPPPGLSDVYQWVVSPDGRCITALTTGVMGGGGVFYGEYSLRSWSISGEEDCVQLPGVHYGQDGVSLFASMVYGLTNRNGFINTESKLWTFEGWPRNPILQLPDMELLAHHPSAYLLAISTRSGEIRLYWYRDGLDVGAVLYGINGPVRRLEFSPEGNYIAASGWDNSICVWRIEDRQRLGSVVYRHFGFGFVPGADELTIFSDKYVWDLSTGQQSPLPELPAGNLLQVRPDGNFVIYAPQTGTYSIYNLEDDRLISEIVMESPTFRQTISQDGSRMAYAFTDRYDNESVRVIDLDNGRMIQQWERLLEEPYQLLFSPDNRFLLVYETGRQGGREHSLLLLEVETGELIAHIRLPEGVVYISEEGLAYSPDGTKIAWVTSGLIDQIPLHTLHIFDLSSQQEVAAVDISGFKGNLTFNVDGSLITFASRSSVIHLLDGTTGQEIRALEGHLGDISQIMFSPDGRHLYSTAADSQLRVWGVAP